MVRLPQIVEAARRDVKTDLTSTEILDWMHRVEPLTSNESSAQTIGGRPAVLYDDLARMRLDFWLPDPADLRAKVHWLVTGQFPPGVTGFGSPYESRQ
jgi:hypothetical protein